MARSQSNLMTADEMATVNGKTENGKSHYSLSPVSDGSLKRAYSMSTLLTTADSNQINDHQVDANEEDGKDGNNKTVFEPVSFLQTHVFGVTLAFINGIHCHDEDSSYPRNLLTHTKHVVYYPWFHQCT